MDTHVALQMYFDRKKKSSPGFSLRSLAKRVDVSPSFLSRIMSGKKAIPEILLKNLARVLDVEPELLSEPPVARKTTKSVVAPPVEDWTVVKQETSQILRNWYYIAIMELTTLENFDGKVETIARRLNLSLQTTEVALRELLSLGLLKIENERYVKTEEKIRFASATSTHLIRKIHDDMLEKAQQELRTATTDEEFQKRLITGITVTCTPEAMQAAKRKLYECLYEIANDLTASPGTEVYHLAAQLFPLSKPE